MKQLLVFQGPVSSRSGYGDHARDLLKSLINMDKYDIKVIDSDGNMKYIEVKTTTQGIDFHFFISGREVEFSRRNKDNYFIYRVGDAVSSRNIHAAIYDSLRICKNL